MHQVCIIHMDMKHQLQLKRQEKRLQMQLVQDTMRLSLHQESRFEVVQGCWGNFLVHVYNGIVQIADFDQPLIEMKQRL